ncbi:MAG: preprotein translocase subunit SecA [Planctomycetaceae bacterium]|nr:preprotein translocase subunit SecA [Planctomycetaceae bacterium]
MEILEKIGDFFTAFMAAIERFITRRFGSSNERTIRKIGFVREKDGATNIAPGSVVDRINQLEPDYEKLTDTELKESSSKFRKRLADGETLDDLLPDAYAAVREAGKRYLKMRHYDVQMVGGYILHQGQIAEMTTGEGKTLVATLPSYLNALSGHVHVITVNDYLALRDMEWMGPVHMGLGLTVGAIQSQMGPQKRQEAYACDITYGTNNEFGFDYLRDNMKQRKEDQVQGPLTFAIVDEIDNILIDEARTPLIISGPAQDDTTKYAKANRVALQLKRDEHFEVKEKEHTCHLTEEGIRHAEQLAGVESFYTAGNMQWPHLIDNSLKAHHLYKRDVNYVVEANGEVVIVDEFTGRKMPGRQWSDGLHQAVEAKEGVRIKEESQTLATITLQNFFKLYKKLGGMTGTAMTEAEEFWKIYKLDVVAVPTNRPMQRVNHNDVIYRTEREKWDAVVGEIRDVNGAGRPILVGTVSIEKSELLSNKLNKYGIKHNVLNAKNHEREAEIIAQAGRSGAVTIATNMAGRGTDIVLGGNPEHLAWEELSKIYESRLDVSKAEWDDLTNKISDREGMGAEGEKVADVGGLHVIGTERHDSRRIDLQLRGRSGRQGDPGSSRFFLSLEDDLMRIFAGEWVKNLLGRIGMEDGEAIESKLVSRRIQGAQKKVEERHFETRKHLLEYDEVMDEQRKQIYSYRQRILDGGNCRELIMNMIEDQVEQWANHFLDPQYSWDTITEWCAAELHVEVDSSVIKGMERDLLVDHLDYEAKRQAEDLILEKIDESLPEDVEDRSEWNWRALSHWANSQFGLNTNDSELRKQGRENLFEYLNGRALEAIGRYDYAPLDIYLDETFGHLALCSWMGQQFGFTTPPEEFKGKETEEAISFIYELILEQYADKEVRFPVTVGLSNCVNEFASGTDKLDRDKLATWCSERFGVAHEPDDFRGKRPNEVEAVLHEDSRKYFEQGAAISELAERVDDVYSGLEPNQSPSDDQLQSLASWSNQNFRSNLSGADFKGLSVEDARQVVLQHHDRVFRPELSLTERWMILDLLDTSWKEHLYYMDHLRSGIGLVGYAQKDPKVEYKRQGMKAFEMMWESISQRVTQVIFRIENQVGDFAGTIWRETSAIHQDAAPAAEAFAPEEPSNAGPEPGAEVKAVETIRNRMPKVGRNDPCPCGSGKKFKKCHGAGGMTRSA